MRALKNLRKRLGRRSKKGENPSILDFAGQQNEQKLKLAMRRGSAAVDDGNGNGNGNGKYDEKDKKNTSGNSSSGHFQSPPGAPKRRVSSSVYSASSNDDEYDYDHDHDHGTQLTQTPTQTTLTFDLEGGTGNNNPHEDHSSSNSSLSSSFAAVEWSLPLVDKEVTEPQTMDEELRRLKALNDYFVLDAAGEEEFDRITRMAGQIFDVPICLISLVDLGRQWFLSKVGLDAAETPRKHAFCAHVILNKYKILVIPDATQDFRFRENPLVVGGPKIRFYSGAALVSPEGYKLGTLCIISPVPRPEGLTDSQQAMLHEMAAMVVSTMVARRDRLIKEDHELRLIGIADTMLDTKKGIEASRTNIKAVLKDYEWNMDSEMTVELSAAVRNLAIQSNMCSAVTRNIVDESGIQDLSVHIKSSNNTSTNSVVSSSQEEKKDSENNTAMVTSPLAFDDNVSQLAQNYDSLVRPVTDLVKLFTSLDQLVPSFPYHGEVSLEMDKHLPKHIVVEDLLLFRSTLNMLIHCMGQSGANLSSEYNQSGLRVKPITRDDSELLVQCLQAGPPIDSDRAKALFAHKESLLGPVASMVRSLGGRYGMYYSKWDPTSSTAPLQSVFWFRIPYEVLTESEESGVSDLIGTTLRNTHVATEKNKNNDTPEEASSSSPSTTTSSMNAKTKITGTRAAAASSSTSDFRRLDPFQAALLDAGCGRR